MLRIITLHHLFPQIFIMFYQSMRVVRSLYYLFRLFRSFCIIFGSFQRPSCHSQIYFGQTSLGSNLSDRRIIPSTRNLWQILFGHYQIGNNNFIINICNPIATNIFITQNILSRFRIDNSRNITKNSHQVIICKSPHKVCLAQIGFLFFKRSRTTGNAFNHQIGIQNQIIHIRPKIFHIQFTDRSIGT